MAMTRIVEATSDPTISAGAYSANDVVGGLLTFSVTSPSGFMMLTGVRVVDDDNEKAASHLYLFNSAPTSIADNDAFAPTLADLKKLVAVVALASADFSTLNSNAVALVQVDSPQPMFMVGSGRLWGYLVCDATPTYTATSDLSITISLMTEGGA